jgi:hypothetical protein
MRYFGDRSYQRKLPTEIRHRSARQSIGNAGILDGLIRLLGSFRIGVSVDITAGHKARLGSADIPSANLFYEALLCAVSPFFSRRVSTVHCSRNQIGSSSNCRRSSVIVPEVIGRSR